MSRQYGYMFRHLKKSFMPRKDFQELLAALKLTLKKTVPLMDDKRVNEIAKKTVPLYVAEGLLLDRKKTQTDLATMIVEAVNSFLRNYMSDNILHVHPTQAASSLSPRSSISTVLEDER
ncbi:hypothetical protein Tco_0343991 [Tanacetum coccineum]